MTRSPKKSPRAMMRMMFAIDKNSFDSNREVTCYSCHRGSRKPVNVPSVDTEIEPKPDVAGNLTVHLPTADQIIDHYIQALGGAAAIEKVTSRDARGHRDCQWKIRRHRSFRSVSEEASVDSEYSRQVTASPGSMAMRDGRTCLVIPSATLRVRTSTLQRWDADLHFPLHIKQMFVELVVEYPEKVGDREAYVISGTRGGEAPGEALFR